MDKYVVLKGQQVKFLSMPVVKEACAEDSFYIVDLVKG